jgi:hypothetical protein
LKRRLKPIPKVQLSSGNFLWLSAPGPSLFAGDLQAWIRDANLDPDWLRVGTDIVGGGTPPKFNGSFTLTSAHHRGARADQQGVEGDRDDGEPYAAAGAEQRARRGHEHADEDGEVEATRTKSNRISDSGWRVRSPRCEYRELLAVQCAIKL